MWQTEAHKSQLFKTLSQALTDFNELNPSTPLLLLLEVMMYTIALFALMYFNISAYTIFSFIFAEFEQPKMPAYRKPESYHRQYGDIYGMRNARG